MRLCHANHALSVWRSKDLVQLIHMRSAGERETRLQVTNVLMKRGLHTGVPAKCVQEEPRLGHAVTVCVHAIDDETCGRVRVCMYVCRVRGGD
jgi:hypothetical protein